jgi:hypothetical protein
MLSGGVSHNNPTTADLFGLFGRSAPEPGVVPPQAQETTEPGAAPADTVEISERSRQLLAADAKNATAPNSATQDTKAPNAAQEENAGLTETDDASETKDTSKTKEAADKPQQLTEEQQEQVKELKDRDREVRAHEQAHLAAAGGHARGGPSYEYQRGPDGQRYAVGGHVNIDTAPVPNDPEATIRKAQTIRNAANAPAEPSSQDRSVAAQARQEISEQRREESNAGLENKNNDQTSAPEETTSPATDSASSASTTPATDATTPATGTLSQAAPVAYTANTVPSQTTGASTQTAPGRFGRSSESVGQLLQLLA